MRTANAWFASLLCAILAVLAIERPARAVPALQIYIDGGVFDATTQTWTFPVTGSGSFDVWVLGNVDAVGTILDVKLSLVYASSNTNLTYSLTPTTTTSLLDLSTPSVPLQIGGVHTTGTPDVTGKGYLPRHGQYVDGVTSWVEFLLGDMTLTDSPIGDFNGATPFPDSFPSTGQINVYTVAIAGLDPGESIHFDAYDHLEADSHGKLFAPFSHDGQGDGTNPPPPPPPGPNPEVPEPASVGVWAVLSACLAGGAWRRQRART